MRTATLPLEVSKQQPSQEIKPCHVKYSGQTREKKFQAAACKPGLVQEIQITYFCLLKTVNHEVQSEVGACNS